jgi:hypothetical protein
VSVVDLGRGYRGKGTQLVKGCPEAVLLEARAAQVAAEFKKAAFETHAEAERGHRDAMLGLADARRLASEHWVDLANASAREQRLHQRRLTAAANASRSGQAVSWLRFVAHPMEATRLPHSTLRNKRL